MCQYLKLIYIHLLIAFLSPKVCASNVSNENNAECEVTSAFNLWTCVNNNTLDHTLTTREDHGRIFLSEGTRCVQGEDTSSPKTVECVEGQWVNVQHLQRSKRFLGNIFKKIKCGLFGCKKNPPPPPPNRSPSIWCPAIASTYYSDKWDVSVSIWWSAPQASDPDGDPVTIALTQGRQPGSRFEEGSYTITYMANDNRGAAATCSFGFSVIVRRCASEATYIDSGSVSCQLSQRNIYGAVCDYRCNEGYELAGASRLECYSNSQWSAPKPFCRMITCPAPPSVDRGQFTCSSGGYSYLSTCYLSCGAGYAVERDNAIRCQANKQWTTAGICVDVEPPRLNCGSNIDVFAGPRLGKVSVQWPQVTASDNSGLGMQVEGDLPSGYYFDVGQTAVRFTARDARGNIGRCTKLITVSVKRCPYYESIENADVSCSHADAYGSVCTSVCNQGYQLVGGDSQTCQQNQTWSGSKPSCTPRECGAPPYVSQGNYSCPTGLRYKDVCTLNCNPGFKRVTPITIVCKSDQQWSVSGSCLDIEAPKFPNGCPKDFEVIATAVHQPNYVNYTLPEAVDNSGEGVVIRSNPISGSDFQLGANQVVVSATDSTGNQANCSFYITVKSVSCDAPNLDTSGKNVIVYDCPDQFVYDASCLMNCSSGDPLTGSNRVTCDKINKSMELDWKIEGNAYPYCNPKSCRKLKPPINGALACISISGATDVCNVMCNEQYTYPYQAPFQLTCIKRIGTWLPNVTLQGCVKKGKVKAVTTELQFYYYTGSCSNDSIDIKQKFVQAVALSIFSDLCSEDSACTLDSVDVSCGTFSRRKRRDTQSTAHEYQISVIINIGEYRDMGSPESTFQYYDKIVMGINDKIQAKADAGLLNVPSIGTFDMFDYGQVGLKCDPGMKMVQRTMACAGCGAGYMFNNETESCLSCPVGTYQDKDVAFSCMSCPVGKTTKDKSSNSLSQCLDLCPPGTLSENGTKPCKPCPVGTYQSDIGMKQCNKCPYGTSTTLPGQNASSACQFFDVRMTENSRGPVIQIYDVLTSSFTLTAWLFETTVQTIAPFKDNNETSAKFILDQAEIILTPSAPDSKRNLRIWNHIAITYLNGNMTLYLNGLPVKSITGVLFSTLYKKSIIFKPSSQLPYVIYNGVQMSTTYFTSSQIKELSASCNKQLDKQVLASNPLDTTFISASTCNDKDLCSGKPCGQHGVCVIGSQNLTCQCDSPWSGDRCQNVTDFCADNLCANGSTCVNRPEDRNYTCSCAPGFFGLLCHDKLEVNTWGVWGPWSNCSSTCGSGQRTRVRQCQSTNTGVSPMGCQGNSSQTTTCWNLCLDCQWAEWVTSPCSGTCGDQQAIRTRKILHVAINGGVTCQGVREIIEPCNVTACPVDGKFGDWSEWSQCSASCGGGSSIRRRLCDNPPPSNGGAQCDSSLAVEKRACNPNICPECILPSIPPGHKPLNCSHASRDGMMTCEIECQPGLTLLFGSNKTIKCGPATNYTWTHQTLDNPTGLLPSCTEMKLPTEVQPEIVVTFAIDCNNKNQVSEIGKNISARLTYLGCTDDRGCFSDISSKSSCGGSRRRSLGTLSVNIVMSVTTNNDINPVSKESKSEQESKKLMNLENILNQLVNQTDDGLILPLSGSLPSGRVESAQTSVLCQEGAGYNGYCVDCPAGTYSNGNGSCVLCDKGYFQEQPRMTYCKQCPRDQTTSSKGSYSSQQCTSKPVKFDDIYPIFVQNNVQPKQVK